VLKRPTFDNDCFQPPAAAGLSGRGELSPEIGPGDNGVEQALFVWRDIRVV
jgi:hypothetical protein